MSLFKKSKQQIERKAFRLILAKKTTQAARQAYEEEAVKVAIEKAKGKARRPSFGEAIKTYKTYTKSQMAKQRTRRPTKRISVSRKTPRQPQTLSQALYGY